MSRPFDEARYRGLLEGLEVVELPLTEVLSDNRVFRFDAQYFAKTALQIESTLKGGVWCELIGASDRVDSFGAYALTNEFSYVEEGVPFLRCLNIRQGFTDFSDVLFVSEKANTLLSKSEIQPGMVLLTMSGSVGNASVALPNWKYPVNSNQDIAKITPKHGVDSYYLAAFLGSRFGRAQMERLPVGSVQQHIFLWMIEKLVIRRLSPETESAIGKAVSDAYSLEQVAVEDIQHAEQTLLRALGLENWQPPEPLTYTRPSRDAFAAGRLDAEHFTPKYAELEAHLLATGRFTTLETLLAINERGSQPDYAEGGLPVINSKHIANGEVRLDDDNRLAIAGSRGLKIRHGDVLMNGTGVGTIGRTAPYLHVGEALPDNHVTVLRPKAGAIDPVYLSVFLNSLAGQFQVNKWLRGSSGQIELYPNDIGQFLVWIAPDEIQQSIRKAIDDAFAAKRNAIRLLDAAKRAVEIAIEDSEAAALAWLEQATALAEPPISCDHGSQEPHHDHPATTTPRPTPEDLARRPSGRGQHAGGLSRPGAGVHPEFHGPGERAGGAQGGGSPADSTRPLDATRELATAAGSLTYTQVSERLAAKVADCLDELLDAEPEDIAITPDWLRELHRRIAGELFPDWAGRFRSTDVQVGTHFPPPAHALAVHVRDFCLDLEERLRHLAGAESIADLLAWVDWRFQWIHPFKDFNGRVGRILLVALAYKLGLPPMDPAAVEDKEGYFAALRGADAGDPEPLRAIWLARLVNA